ERAAPVDRRAATAEVAESYRRHVVGEREGALQHRVRERVIRRIVRLESLPNGRAAVAGDGAHGADTASVDRHPRSSRRPRAQIAEVREARPDSLDRRDELVANRHSRHREPPSFGKHFPPGTAPGVKSLDTFRPPRLLRRTGGKLGTWPS